MDECTLIAILAFSFSEELARSAESPRLLCWWQLWVDECAPIAVSAPTGGKKLARCAKEVPRFDVSVCRSQ